MTLKTIVLCLDQNAISHQLTKFHTIPTLLPKFMHCEFLAPLLFQECICYLFYIKDTCWTWLQACPSLFFLFGKNDRHGRGHDWNTACAKKKVKAWNTLYLRVTPTSFFFFFPLKMELGQIYFYFVISPFCPFILAAYA